jgi:hypothetical protein
LSSFDSATLLQVALVLARPLTTDPVHA